LNRWRPSATALAVGSNTDSRARAHDRAGRDQEETMPVPKYPELTFDLSGLNGISDAQLAVHFKLYAGYVANTNSLNEQLGNLEAEGKAGTPTWAELKRRAGWEYNGKILHELYFGNLAKSPKAFTESNALGKKIQECFGGFEAYKKMLTTAATMRGIGWVITYQDPTNGWLTNHWVTEHEIGHPAGFRPVLVLDMWEHAFMVDYKPADKAKYIEAFLSNVDWSSCDRRLG
jgi:Fe-Mn family superoxide dismutase